MQSAKGSFYVPTFKPADVNQNNFIHEAKYFFALFNFSNLQCNNSIQQNIMVSNLMVELVIDPTLLILDLGILVISSGVISSYFTSLVFIQS